MNGVVPRAVGSLGSGDHVCFAYDSAAEHEAVLSAFVARGLERNERVFYFTDDQPVLQILNAFEQRGIDCERHLEQTQLFVATAQESYLPTGRFDPDACIRGWLESAQRAVADGFGGIRVAGDMGWAARGVPGSHHLMEYERRIQDEVFTGGLVTGMCEFDRRRFKDISLQALLNVHPDGAVHADALVNEANLLILPLFEPFGAWVSGEIDVLTADKFERALRGLADGTGADIHLDFGAVRFMGASGLSALVRFARDLESGRCVVVLNMAPRFRQVMEILGWGQAPGLIFF